MYDTATNTWENLPTLELDAVSLFQPTCLNGVVYIIHPLIGSYPDEIPTESVTRIDATSQSPSLVTGDEISQDRRRGSSGCVAYEGCIYGVGGIQNGHISGTLTFFDKNTGLAIPRLGRLRLPNRRLQRATAVSPFWGTRSTLQPVVYLD